MSAIRTALSSSVALLACLAAGPAVGQGPGPSLVVRTDDKTGRVEVYQAGVPVLRYNFQTVPVPRRLAGRKYAEPRSDYIHPLYGPDGEVLTRDYAADHPHHRGVYWAWPEVGYKGQLRDLHALQGLFARPGRLVGAAATPGGATLEAESLWKWDDTEPIVNERVVITVHKAARDGSRTIDLALRFSALVDGVTLARRGQKLYGGLNLRTSLNTSQKITCRNDPAGATPRRSWGQIVGVPDGGRGPVAIAIFQHPSNAEYPGDWIQYPRLAWLQPTFPTAGARYALSKTRPLVLRYRYWIRRGAATEAQLAAAWDAYVKNVPARPAGGDRTEAAR